MTIAPHNHPYNLNGPIVILGAGQVGSALKTLLGNHAILLDRSQADLTHPATLEKVILPLKPAAIINAAAYTQVDKAESEEQTAFTVNALAPEALAVLARKLAIPLVHYSTDYVFPGDKKGAWQEDDATAPLNAYGRTKLAGEQKIRAIGGKWLIFRTSWVYDHQGKNFLTTMLRLGSEREELSVVSDQVGSPTYAPALAEATLTALTAAMEQPEFPSGIYHLCGSGATNWHQFATTIFALAGSHCQTVKKVVPIATAAYKTPAQRPLNSVMDCGKAARQFRVTLPEWRDSLRACMEHLYENSTL